MLGFDAGYQPGAPIETTLRRITVGYRVVAAVWLLVLSAVALGSPDPALRRSVVAATMLLVVVWTVVTVGFSSVRPAALRHPLFLVVDAAVAAATLLAPGAAGSPTQLFYGGYPLSTVALAVYGRGFGAGIGAGVVLAVTAATRFAFPEFGRTPAERLSQVIIYLFSAILLGWSAGAMRRSERLRLRAEQELSEERARRARVEERAELAARLHDSVLQTLALIQRRAGDPPEVSSLARRQERELRALLFGDERAVGWLGQALHSRAAEIEDRYRVKVDVVTVGDRPLDERLAALVAAAREAMTNAAKHAGVDQVSVYLEADDAAVSVFVRDRGVGFEPDRVGSDRRGIVDSIQARMERHGGRAAVVSRPGGGTEVELVMTE